MGHFAAFAHSNFRRYVAGQVISSVGSWLQAFAVTWLVLDLTGRSDRLGIAVALQFLPLLVLGAPAGVLADRIDNRRLLMATSVTSAAIALTFGVVVSAGTPALWVIYTLTLLSGLVLAVERPAMQALLFQLVGRDALPSAVALNSTIASVARLIGPALAGLMIAVTGIASCFHANAVSYVVVTIALASIVPSRLTPRPIGTRAAGSVRAAVAYVRHRPDVRRPLVVMAVVGLVALNFQTTFPSMVRFGFDRGAGAVGTAMSVSAIGSILGGIYAAGITPDPRRTLAWVLAGFSMTLILFSLAPSYPSFVVLGIPLGFASACFQSVDTVAVQQATEPSMQGRVMALHQMAWNGSTPLGALAMGWVIQAATPRAPFVLGGLAALACAAALARPTDHRTNVACSTDDVRPTARAGGAPPCADRPPPNSPSRPGSGRGQGDSTLGGISTARIATSSSTPPEATSNIRSSRPSRPSGGHDRTVASSLANDSSMASSRRSTRPSVKSTSVAPSWRSTDDDGCRGAERTTPNGGSGGGSRRRAAPSTKISCGRWPADE
jgi:MFS family permease